MKIHIIIYCGGLPTDRPVYKGQGSFPAGLMKDISVLLLLLRGRGNHTAVFVHLMLFCANLRHFKYWIEEKKSGLNISKDLLKIWVFSTEVTSIIKHKPMAWVSHMSTRKCRIQHVARQKKKEYHFAPKTITSLRKQQSQTLLSSVYAKEALHVYVLCTTFGKFDMTEVNFLNWKTNSSKSLLILFLN